MTYRRVDVSTPTLPQSPIIPPNTPMIPVATLKRAFIDQRETKEGHIPIKEGNIPQNKERKGYKGYKHIGSPHP